MDSFDVIVIGAGPVGENAGGRAAAGGLTVALIESELLGGECSYWACMPSKALLQPGHALAAARRLPGSREAVTGTLDVSAVLAHRDAFAAQWDDAGQVRWAEQAGLTVVRGRARLAGARRVVVTDGAGERELHARQAVVLCPGSVPQAPPIDGLAEVLYWGSRQATSASRVPARLGVIGGGVVAVEMAQVYARLGAQVSMMVRADRLLGRMEPIAGELVADALRAESVDLRLNTSPRRVARDGDRVRIELPGETVTVDELLVATGRRPASDDLGLESVGLTPGRPVETGDDGLVTGVDGGWLYAAGDVTGRALLTHQGKYQARVAGDVVVARARGERAAPEPWSRYASTADHRAVPQVVFTDPTVAAVGRTEEQARADGFRVEVVELDIAVAGSALHAEGYTGRARMVIDTDRDVLLGVTFVGQDVAELLHAATVAVVGEVPLRRLWHAVPAFPTISEIWLRLLEAYGL